jgi:hypothetical protein
MKPFKRLQRSRKAGVSVVIATIMAMAILGLAVTQIFIYERTLVLEEQDRLAEKFTINKIYISNNVTHFEVSNIGTVTIHLVALWINNTRYNINYRLNPAEPLTLEENLTGLTENSIFDVVIVTERGLAVASKYSPEPSSEVQASGVFKINWFYFQYTSLQHPTKGEAMVIPSTDDYVAIYMKVVNNWIYPANITVETLVTWVVPYIEVPMYVVKSVSYPSHTITKYTSEITINPQEEVELVFASASKGSSSWVWGTTIPNNLINSNPDHIAYLQLTLFYELIKSPINIEKHGQVLSAQGVYYP